MPEQKSRSQVKKAFERSLDLLDEKSKRSLLFYLEKEFQISFERGSPRIEEIETALTSILGRGAYIITEEFRKNLTSHTAKASGKRLVASKNG